MTRPATKGSENTHRRAFTATARAPMVQANRNVSSLFLKAFVRGHSDNGSKISFLLLLRQRPCVGSETCYDRRGISDFTFDQTVAASLLAAVLEGPLEKVGPK